MTARKKLKNRINRTRAAGDHRYGRDRSIDRPPGSGMHKRKAYVIPCLAGGGENGEVLIDRVGVGVTPTSWYRLCRAKACYPGYPLSSRYIALNCLVPIRASSPSHACVARTNYGLTPTDFTCTDQCYLYLSTRWTFACKVRPFTRQKYRPTLSSPVAQSCSLVRNLGSISRYICFLLKFDRYKYSEINETCI